MKKMLVVDDEAQIRTLIHKMASYDGFEVKEAANGLEAMDLILYHDFDIIILDLMMPQMNGFDTCKMIRKETDTPIIMLTARDGEFDKYQGFELGIDDYVTKPFSPRELMYRVEAVLKRTHTDIQEFKVAGLRVNYAAHALYIDDVAVDLSFKEYALLAFLIRNKGIVVEREQILNKVWGYDFTGDDRTLDTHIKRLRRKLGTYESRIVTVRGVGYRFEA